MQVKWNSKWLQAVRQPVIRLLATACLFAGWPVVAQISETDRQTFDNEPPVVRELLERAVGFESSPDERDGKWQAANLYCEAARLGSAEGQYRLGMLYAFGKGVPENRILGASLFALASGQGHYEAQKMLETIALKSTELPPCVTEAVAPERGFSEALSADAGIERHIANLPANKRWLIELVETLARWYDVDPRLVLSIIAVESNFRIGAKSSKEAMGLMQLIPDTAERFNVKNAFDASQNIRGGIAYVRWLLAYFQGDVRLAVAGYNAGEGAVVRHKGVPPYAETQQYVKRVMQLYGKAYHPYDKDIVQPSGLQKERLKRSS